MMVACSRQTYNIGQRTRQQQPTSQLQVTIAAPVLLLLCVTCIIAAHSTAAFVFHTAATTKSIGASSSSSSKSVFPSRRTIPTGIHNANTNRIGRGTQLSASSSQNIDSGTMTQHHQGKKEEKLQEKFLASGPTMGPPLETKPDYENIFGPLGKFVDHILLSMFHNSLKNQVFDYQPPKHGNYDSSVVDNASYDSIIKLADIMNQRYSNNTVIHEKAQKTLQDLFPPFILNQYPILFSKPFPEFSARMNAWATRVGGTWLMGECEVNDIVIEDDDGNEVIAKNQGLLVKRCRFLEESGCASVCVNSCKIPTQNFFMQDMKIPLLMEPDYETYECQFSFGKAPTVQSEMDAKSTPCLQRCPTYGSLRTKHNQNKNNKSGQSDSSIASISNGQCQLIQQGNDQ